MEQKQVGRPTRTERRTEQQLVRWRALTVGPSVQHMNETSEWGTTGWCVHQLGGGGTRGRCTWQFFGYGTWLFTLTPLDLPVVLNDIFCVSIFIYLVWKSRQREKHAALSLLCCSWKVRKLYKRPEGVLFCPHKHMQTLARPAAVRSPSPAILN